MNHAYGVARVGEIIECTAYRARIGRAFKASYSSIGVVS
jgi:hypothetical protein